MSLEVVLGIAALAAVVVFVVIMISANKDVNVPVVAVPVKDLQEQVPFVAPTPIPVEPVINLQQQALEQRIKELDRRLLEAEELSTANDALRFDNQSLKKEMMETTEKYRELLVKFDSLKSAADATAASLIKEKEISHHQLILEVDDLNRTVEKLKELNTAMTLKSDMLQYELIKARAQAVGYERISQNYQHQLESLPESSKVNRLEVQIVER